MKKLNIKFRYITSLLLAFALASCSDFLEIESQNAVSDKITITDKASAETAVRGAYNALSSSSYYGLAYQSLGYLSGDNLTFTGTQIILNEFVLHNVRSDNSYVSETWKAIYTTINRANHVIAKVPAVTDLKLTAALKDQLVGEAYFLRALSYFDLVRFWGGVQITLTPTESVDDKAGIVRSSADETYAQVLKDLEAAEPLLPATTNRFRATRKTVWALRARYHLYRGEWAKAEEYATKVISDVTNYSLKAPYSSFFAGNVTGTAESVFEISYNSTNLNTHRTSWQPTANGGNRNWVPSAGFLALLFDANIGGNRKAMVAQTTTAPILWYGNMYYRNPATDPAYVIRIAELYLIRAEALAKQNKLTESAADLNAVRTRAALAATSAATQSDLLLAIENERRLEFAFEPHRWFDLIRTGRAAAVLGLTDANRYLLPIPLPELQVDKALVQNPGYL